MLRLPGYRSVEANVGERARQGDPRRLAPITAGLLLAPQRQPSGKAETQPQPQVDDEQDVAIEPAAAERLEQANAVVVQPIEGRMAQAGNEAESVKPAEMDWHTVR